MVCECDMSLLFKKSIQMMIITKCIIQKIGAGKSTILYKHLANDVYSSTDSMIIPKTITYNREQIKPKKKSRPSQSKNNQIHKRHHSFNNLSIPVIHLSHYKSKPYTHRQYNRNHNHNHLSVPTSKSAVPQPRLKPHYSYPTMSRQTQKQRNRHRHRHRHPFPINPVQPPLSNTQIQIQIPQLHSYLVPVANPNHNHEFIAAQKLTLMLRSSHSFPLPFTRNSSS